MTGQKMSIKLKCNNLLNFTGDPRMFLYVEVNQATKLLNDAQVSNKWRNLGIQIR